MRIRDIVSAARRRRETHEAIYSSASVQYIMTAQLSRRPHLAKSSRRLLDAEAASAAAWPSEDQIRTSRRMRLLARSIFNLRNTWTRYEKARETRKIRDGIVLLINHPRIGLAFLKELSAPRVQSNFMKFVENPTFPSLFAFTMRHPVSSIKHVLPNIRLDRGPSKIDDENNGGDQGVAECVGEDADPSHPLSGIDEAEDLILQQQFLASIERKSDARLLGGRDRDEDRFVRLSLRNTRHEVYFPGNSNPTELIFEPRLLIHESGALQLTLRIETQDSLTTDQLLDLANGTSPRVVSSELPTAIMLGSGWATAASDASQLDSAIKYSRVEHESRISMIELSHAILQGLMAIIRNNFLSWLHHPVIFTQPGNCCSQTEWRKTHEQTVLRLSLRAPGPDDIASHVRRPADLSLRSDHSLYTELGSSLYLQNTGAAPVPIDELWTVLVIEYALLIHMRLQALEEKVSRSTLKSKNLRQAYTDTIGLFSELRQGNLRSGESREIASSVLKALGTNNIPATIQTALELASGADAARSASQASRSSWRLAAVATAIAMLVAIPSLDQVLRSSKIALQDNSSNVLLGVLAGYASLGFWGPFALVGSIVLAILILSCLGFVLRKMPKSLHWEGRGFSWPTPIEFVSPEEMDSTPEGSS